ncbi:MAG: ribosome biogenesis GTPase Der [Oscillospiraceae bacterium]|jgi:GTP-binding protein|nr:ribosome biogenesis GTPase Der [Oscillospiraceae bacterium]
MVAIVGRTNVGKSTLFNKLIGRKKSITLDAPGVTRDRIFGECEWNTQTVSFIDTGGFEPNASKNISNRIQQQIKIAIAESEVVVFVVDLKTGVTVEDLKIAGLLVKINKPVVVAVNKCDSLGAPVPEFYEFYNLGFGTVVEISSAHGHGIGNLLDVVFSFIDFESNLNTIDDMLRIAVIGRPNAGKSSLINCLTAEERVIVSEIAGTTRDAVDTVLENEQGQFVLIDTAGIRKKSKVEEDIEYFSVIRAFKTVDSADVCLMLIDAVEGPAEQDTKIAGYVHEKGKAIVIVVNKWDLIEKETGTMSSYRRNLQEVFAFMSYAPFCFISTKTGQRVEKLLEEAKLAYAQNSRRLTTGTLNVMLAEAVTRVQPPSDKGKRLKVGYITQTGVNPPTFVVFVNKLDLFHFSYKRYIENQIREVFGLNSTPLRLIARERKHEK